MLKRHGLDRERLTPQDRRRFEAELANDLWQADCMHGPKIVHEGKLRKSYLFACIDDHSRLIPNAQFYLFSVDLDFSLLSAGGCAGREWMTRVKRDLAFAGFQVDVSWNERHAVRVGWVRVAGLLREAGLAAMPAEKLLIKIEINTNPPNGAHTEKRVVTRYVTFLLHHHDLPSLMAGKITAVLTRKYTKGRDWYDLAWYLSHRPPVTPNLELLGSALEQARDLRHDDAADWPSLVRERLAALDLDAVARDVRPFLERPEEALLLTRGNLAGLLQV